MKFSEYNKKYNNTVDGGFSWEEEYDFNVGHLVSEARLYGGLTQHELAKLMGTQQPSVARVERGSILPGHDFLKRMARAIGVPLLAPKFAFKTHIGQAEASSDESRTSRSELAMSQDKRIIGMTTDNGTTRVVFTSKQRQNINF